MNREQLFAAFFFAVFLSLLFQFYRVFGFFITPLMWAALLAIVFYPVQASLSRALRDRTGVASFLLTTAVIFIVIGPTIVLVSVLATESITLVKRVQEMGQNGELGGFIGRLKASAPGQLWERLAPQLETWNLDLASLAAKGANAASGFLVSQAGDIAANVFRFVGNFFFTTFALFFFFRDGERMVRGFRDLVPMAPEHKDQILTRLYETVSAVVQGTLATAVVQGVLAGIAYAVLGMPFAVLLGFLTALFSLIPFGPPLVWLGVAGYFAFEGQWIRMLLMVGWGAGVIGVADNVIRPLIIGGKTQIPTIFLFFGILGGLQAYGFLGIFLGPVLIAILVAFLRIYREQYAGEDEGQKARHKTEKP